jgi:hypothetical protein
MLTGKKRVDTGPLRFISPWRALAIFAAAVAVVTILAFTA